MRRRSLLIGGAAVAVLAGLGLPGSPAAWAASTEDMLKDRVLGKADAPVTIIEYASFTCPHCATFHVETLPHLKKEYLDTGKAKLIFRDFPFDEPALRASMLARCMPTERYFPVVETLFKSQNQWAKEKDATANLARIGKLAGMSDADFKTCMANNALMDGILKVRLDGEKNFGVQSTPTFIINDKNKISGNQPAAEFDKVIKPLLPKS
ncbi:MAG: DsbA family protein [Alphaproteobacteria bacterium]|nr:DsbA family protein [Alphaproteobacteria bacterium]